MSPEERRSARLLFSPELAAGTLTERDLEQAAVGRAVRARPVPPLPMRIADRMGLKGGRISFGADNLAPMLAARTAVLGDAAGGSPRLLVRVDEFPHARAWDRGSRFDTAAYRRFHTILHEAGVPYLVAVLPRIARDPKDPKGTEWRAHDEGEREMLRTLAADGVAFATHGLDHRTRSAIPRRHSELVGLDDAALAALLDAAQEALAEQDIDPRVFVAPYNRFTAAQYAALAARFDIVTGGPESVRRMGFQRTPMWRGEAVYLPGYPPLYGKAAEMIHAIGQLVELRAAVWVPIVLHWEWEARDDFAGLRRWAAAMTGLAQPWSGLLDAIDRSRAAEAQAA
jgi:peptidoglycan/xylan/chitin deacetylase (PgdA/CDA1 family)